MWIFLNDAFFSIVRPAQGSRLLVRARKAGDINKHFPKAKVTFTPNADYHYRALISEKEVSAKIKTNIEKIDYSNFKDSVPENGRHNAYLGVWTAMHHYQYTKGR